MFESIGQRLKHARQERNLSIEKASEATHIRPHYLQALEADDYSVMPSAPQARGFLRNYTTFLEIDLDAVLAEMQAAQPVEVSGPLPQVELAPAAPEAPASPPAEDKPTPLRFWNSWLARLRKPESTPEPDSAQPESESAPEPKLEPEPTSVVDETPALVVEETPPPAPVEAPKRRVRKQKEEEAPASSEKPTVRKRRKRVEEPVAAQVEQVQPEAEIPPVEVEQVEAPKEAEVQPSLLTRARSIFQSIIAKKSTAPEPEIPAAEPVVEVQSTPEAAETPEEIFTEIGAMLRKRREMLSLTYEEIERHTHVRAVFAKALEEGDFDQLPSAVQTRGMLTTYATFLDLDNDALLLRFADALQAGHRARYPDLTGTGRRPKDVRSSMPSLRSFMAGDMLFGLGMVVMLVALAIWGLGRVFAQQTEQVTLPTAPSISDVLGAGTPLPTVVQEVTLIAAADTPFALAGTDVLETPTETATPDLNVSVSLNIVATERTFMRVIVDGEEVFNGRVVPGTAYPFDASASIQVLAGNGAALRITYNGRDLGLLGTFGQVVDFIYSANSIVTPTPPSPPTATATPKVSPTPSPTPSPTQTPTPTRTSTPSG